MAGVGWDHAANFVEDGAAGAQRRWLLGVIRGGKAGKIGVMPAWGEILEPQEQTDVLAYIRATFQKQTPGGANDR